MLATWDAVSRLDRMFDDVMGSVLGTAISPVQFNPAIDLHSSDEDVVFTCDVPGMRAEDLDITLENHVLTIQGTRRYESKEGEQVVLERSYGQFTRSFVLPEYLDESQLSANLADGVLSVRIPKQASARPVKIPVSVGREAKQLTQ